MFLVASFYEFAQWTRPQAENAARALVARAEARGIHGLCIVAAEGLNGTCAGPAERLRAFLDDARAACGLALSNVKESWSEAPPFVKFRAPVRDEIVSLGDPELHPLTAAPGSSRTGARLSPAEFREAMREPGAVVLDARNWYESQIGKFKGAIEPKTEEFHEFPAWLSEAKIAKDQPVLIYCTGGIRCEKAILQMEREGFSDVRQLDGGILRFLEEFPEQEFEGELFVFDRRVAVDQRLRPSARYRQCPHCGQPSERPLDCVRCGEAAYVCTPCAGGARDDLRTCSKNCAHHWRLAPGKRGRPQAPAPISLIS